MSFAAGREPFKKSRPCPLCGGYESMSREADRCYGYREGDYVNCTNTRYAGGIERHTNGTYGHLWAANKKCNCGEVHDMTNIQPVRPLTNRNIVEQASGKVTALNQPVEVAHWDYTDEAGNPVTRVIRYEQPDGSKTYKQKRFTDSGEWEWGMGHISHLLYRLPDLLALPPEIPILVVEGEKAADACWEQNIAATTNIGGAGKGWHEDYTNWLKPHPVIIVPDNDDAGTKHAAAVAAQVYPACAVKLLEPLPGVGKKGDTYDFFKVAGKGREDFLDFAKKYEWKRPPKLSYSIYELDLLPKVEWLLDDMFVKNSISMTVGESEVGKTFASIHYGLRVAASGKLVLYLGIEAISQYPERIKAWLNYYQKWDAVSYNFQLLNYELQLMNSDSVDGLIQFIQNAGWKPEMIVIDTYHAATEGAEENSARDTGIILTNLRKLRNTFKANINVLHHLNASGLRERGSSALKAGMDTVVTLKSEGDGVKVECGKQRSAAHFATRFIDWAYVENPLDTSAPRSRVVKESTGGTTVDLMRASKNDERILITLGAELYKVGGMMYGELKAALLDMAESSLNLCLKKLQKAGWVNGGGKTPYRITNDGLSIIGFEAGSIEDY